MRKNLIRNQSGFSLIELMVVVAIMGVLAAIGVPQYSKFQAKARQSEAKNSLASLYTAQQSFMMEFNLYTVDLRNIGFGVSGQRLRYVTGFAAGACGGYAAAYAAAGAPAEATTVANTWSDGGNVNVGIAPATFAAAFAKTMPSAGTSSACTATVGSQAFRAVAIGDPNSNVTTTPTDGWTINQTKLVSNSTPGIQ